MRIVVSEPEDVRASVEKWSEQVAASYAEKDAARAQKLAPQELLLAWPDVEPILAPAQTLEELAIGADETRRRSTSRRSPRRSSAAALPTGSRS